MRRYYRKSAKALVALGISNLLAAASSVYLSLLLGNFANAAFAGSAQRVWRMAGGAVCYVGIQTLLDFLLQYTRDAAVQKIGRDIRMDLICKIEALPLETKCRHDNGWYTSLIYNDTGTVEREYLDSLGAIHFQLCCLALALACSLRIQPVMTVLISGVSILLVAFPKLTEGKLQHAKEEAQQAKAAYLSSVDQILNGYTTLKIFHRFSHRNREHRQRNEALCTKEIRYSRMQSLLYAGAYGCGNLVFLGTWVVGLFFVQKQLLTLPLLITFSQLMTFVAGPAQIISERYSATIGAQAVCKRLLDFLDGQPEEQTRWGSRGLGQIDEISLEHLSYSPGERRLLDDICLTLHRGDRVALVGKSGSGKSTLLKALAGLWEGEGSCRINGLPLHEYGYGAFRERAALLEQKTFVFDGSLWENVSLFRGEPDPEELERVLKAANLMPWYQGRGGRPEMAVGREREALSGGEERRLDLARVLHQRAGLVLLDEPTTGLDGQSKQQVEDTIHNLQCDILVAATHDTAPGSLQGFNRVIEMENGRLRELRG
ncbi:MAG: ABC transporter ATP-binding protein [Eubacteriales bacterium]|nr:ABC transporter ATP-binding protein [Eubacteriales bacterium]